MHTYFLLRKTKGLIISNILGIYDKTLNHIVDVILILVITDIINNYHYIY